MIGAAGPLTVILITVAAALLVSGAPAAVAGGDEAPGMVTVALWGPFGRSGADPGRLGRQMRAAADHAVAAAAQRLGVRLRLVTGSETGAWGAGSRRLVDLVYRERAIAIVGPTDPGSAHLGLQLATRARIPLLCPAPPDPGLTRAGTPWIFSLLPDTRARAAALARLAEQEDWSTVHAVFQASRAGRAAERAVREATDPRGVSLETVLVGAGSLATSPPGLPVNCDAIVVWSEMPGEDVPVRVLKSWSREGLPGGTEVVFSGPLAPSPGRHARDGCWLLSGLCAAVLNAKPTLAQRASFGLEAGERPDPVALATHDALWLLALTVADGHCEPSAVREHLARVKPTGLTGAISFHADGSRDREPFALRLRRGRWVRESRTRGDGRAGPLRAAPPEGEGGAARDGEEDREEGFEENRDLADGRRDRDAGDQAGGSRRSRAARGTSVDRAGTQTPGGTDR